MSTSSAQSGGSARHPYRAASRPGPAPLAAGSTLDYYLIRPDNAAVAGPAGILVEEFTLGEGYAAVRLDSTGWTAGGRRWQDASAFSRGMRTDAGLRERVVGVARQEVEFVYRHLGGGELPTEETLRGYFEGGTRLPGSAPLRLSPARVTAGFFETRGYRILFTAGLDRDGLTKLLAIWRMAPRHDAVGAPTGVVGTARRRIGHDAFTWELRRVGGGAAWSVDLTADLAGSRDDTIGPLLRELTTAARLAGLIPVTIERLR